MIKTLEWTDEGVVMVESRAPMAQQEEANPADEPQEKGKKAKKRRSKDQGELF